MTLSSVDPLGDVRPGRRPSWWLREAIAADPGQAVPPLVDETSADVAIVGGGYTGLWTAVQIAERDPSARVVLIEQGICGSGPSGRNGGFVTSWWDELPDVIRDFGVEHAVTLARETAATVDAIGAWCDANRIDAWFRKAGYVIASATPVHDRAFDAVAEACARNGGAAEYIPLSAAEVAARCASPVLRNGVFIPSAATVQPARLARGLRRVILERGVTIHEGTRLVAIDRPSGGGPVELRTDAGGVPGRIRAEQVVLGLNAWAAGWAYSQRRLVNWSSYIVLTEPIPDRLAELGWTGGEGLCDARFTLHYLRTTPDGRIALGGGGGRAGWGGRDRQDVHRGRGLGAARRCRAAAAVPEPGRRPDRGRLGRPDRHLRRPPPVLRDVAGRAGPFRPRVQRQRRRSRPPRRPDPRGARARSTRRPGPRAADRRSVAAPVPAGPVPVRRGHGRP